MNRIYRYMRLFRHANFGFSLPKGSMINYMKLRMGMYDNTVGSKSVSFPMVSILTVSRCNLKCSFCIYSGFPRDWETYELTPVKFQKILDLGIMKKCILICFSGGEALLNDDLPTLIRMARKRGHLTGMITNGLLLKEKAKSIKDAGLNDSQVSIYDDTSEKLRTILPTISSMFPINASYVLRKSKLSESSKGGFRDLTDLIEMCMNSGCASIKFNLCEPTEENDNFNEAIVKGNVEYDTFVDLCLTTINNVDFSGYKCRNSILPKKKFSIYFPNPVEVNPAVRFCRMPWSVLRIDAEGNYGICCKLLAKPGGPHGNVFRDGEGVINSPKAMELRECLINIDKPLVKECVRCFNLNGSYASRV